MSNDNKEVAKVDFKKKLHGLLPLAKSVDRGKIYQIIQLGVFNYLKQLKFSID